MAKVTVRSVPDAVHRAIRLRAVQHGRSLEAEIRDILIQSVYSPTQLRVGTELRRFAAEIGGAELEISRDPTAINPAVFE
jgi:antitoxin FitA